MGVRIEANSEPVPGYRLIERLGGGGFGEVWKCEAPGGLLKAIKFVFGTLQTVGDSGQHAEQELKALKRIATVRHPYVLSLERYDIVDGQLMIIMELADRNLWDRFRECRGEGLSGIPREELLGYLEEAAEALDLMSSQYQLQHLDIKPQNLFLVHNHVKVADFGLVKDMQGSQASVTGGITPVYAAPETFDGRVTRFSDQYSLAIVFQELLTGQRPFTGNNVRQLILQHLQAHPVLEPLDPPDQPIVGRALSKEPGERYPTCCSFMQALRQAKIGPEGSQPAVGLAQEVSPPVGIQRPAPRVATRRDAGVTGRDETALAPGITPNTPKPAGACESSTQTPTQFIGVPASFGPSKAPRTPPASPAPSDTPVQMEREIEGTGVLFPAVIVGVGGLGAQVLQAFRLALGERFGTPDALPQLRTILLDTDGDVLRQLAQLLAEQNAVPTTFPLLAADFLLAPLNRPGHYLRPSGGRVPVESWLNQRMLYRIPREQLTTGVRALGRLALFDHVKAIQRRLQVELEACSAPQALAAASQATGLGVRSGRPRVYLVTGLMGGTGSGMFLDLAYLLRQLLRQMGHAQPEVTGLLFVPEVSKHNSQYLRGRVPGVAGGAGSAHGMAGRSGSKQGTAPGAPSAGRIMAVGNACAALKELLHFSRPHVDYQARYYEREAPVSDTGAPFARSYLLTLSENSPQKESQEVIGMAARFLLGECASGFGRWRSIEGIQTGSPVSSEPHYQTFGLFRVSFPRSKVIRLASQQCLTKVVERWMSKDARPLENQVRNWVSEQWRGQDIGAEHFITRVQEASSKRVGKDPEEGFTTAMEPLLNQLASGRAPADPRQKILARMKAVPGSVDPDNLLEVLMRLEQMLGRPEIVDQGGGTYTMADWGLAARMSPEQESSRGTALTVKLPGATEAPPGSLVQALREVSATLAAEWSQKLAELPVRLIELPAFRLAGAEEAVRQVVKSIEEVLERHEPLGRELADRTAQAYGQLLTVLIQTGESKAAPRRASTPESVVELLRTYAKSRYQSLVLQQVLSVYVSLRGCLTDDLREINFCRARLKDILTSIVGEPEGKKDDDRSLKTPPPADSASPLLEGRVRYLFPRGWENMGEAVVRFLEKVSVEDTLELDCRLQKLLREHYVALVQVCLSTKHATREVVNTLEQGTFAYVEEKLAAPDLAQLFVEGHPDEAGVIEELRNCCEEAVPELASGGTAGGSRSARQYVVLCVPRGLGGEALGDLARQVLQEFSPTVTQGEDDFLFYREWVGLLLADASPLGPAGIEAYEQLAMTDNFTPHSRCDVTF